MSRYFDWTASLKRFVRFDTARSEDVNDALDELTAGLDDLDLDVNRSIKLPIGTADQTLALGAGARANKMLGFDASGNVTVSSSDMDSADESAATAVAAASTATAQAGIATTQAGIATTQAGLATTNGAVQVALATAQADIATAKAAEATASAASIAGGPVASVNGMTGVVTGIATQTGAETLTNKTIAGAVLNDGYTEEVFAVTGTTPALSPTNGSIQTWTLSGASTPTYGTWAAGQSIVLMITAGANSINWPATTWSKVGGGGAAPTLTSSGATCVILWKVGTTTYGALLGSV